MDVDTAMTNARKWLDDLAESGPDLRVNAHRKAVREAQELVEDPSLEEAADVLICLVGYMSHKGWTNEQLADAVEEKVYVNIGRTWTQQEDGTWQHD